MDIAATNQKAEGRLFIYPGFELIFTVAKQLKTVGPRTDYQPNSGSQPLHFVLLDLTHHRKALFKLATITWREQILFLSYVGMLLKCRAMTNPRLISVMMNKIVKVCNNNNNNIVMMMMMMMIIMMII